GPRCVISFHTAALTSAAGTAERASSASIAPDEDASRVSSSAIRAATCSSDSPLASWLAARAMRNCQRRSWSISRPGARSEEHTSELQSRFDLVCRLLLEKKKTRREASGEV